ncbi:Gfo/Idh/MocA family oxidoreductase [bacterium]|nr:MAG: Gfo/Idh/MocA family oxidoreductase [bacterium]
MDKVRVAMVGCGGFQRYRVSNLEKVSGAEIVALVDPSDEQIRLMKEQRPVTADAPSFNDLTTMLAEVKPDAIMIATPHTQHVDQILQGFDAGCHVCCEKPLVTTVDDAWRVIRKRDETGKVGMVSYQRHFQAEFRYIKKQIDSGKAGAPQYIQVLQTQEWLRAVKGTWRQLKSLSGGGQLNDSGSHVMDIVLWVTGLSPKSVSAYCDDKGTEVDINSSLSVAFHGGAMGSIAIVGDGMSWHEDITIVCENEAYFIRDGKLTVTDRDRNRIKAEHLSGGSTPDQNFIDAIQGKAECESPFECGLEVIRLTEAAWESAYEKAGGAVAVTK